MLLFRMVYGSILTCVHDCQTVSHLLAGVSIPTTCDWIGIALAHLQPFSNYETVGTVRM